MKAILLLLTAVSLVSFSLTGCNSYIPPGPKADLAAMAPPDIQAGFDAKPTNPFPASIATVRVQAAGYRNHYLDRNGGTYGSGRYTVVLTREVEEQAAVDRIAALPQVAGVVALNRMLLPPEINSDQDIRMAASRLQADLVLLYTFDTAFYNEDKAKPLTVISLGLSPTRRITAITTASALLMDTRTGYIYSAYEVTEHAATLATSWGSKDSADAVRRQTERRAFGKLVDEVAAAWPKVLQRYAAKS